MVLFPTSAHTPTKKKKKNPAVLSPSTATLKLSNSQTLKLLFSMGPTESNFSLIACSSEDGKRTNFRNVMVSITQMVEEVKNNNK
jgi:hypothetical protein